MSSYIWFEKDIIIELLLYIPDHSKKQEIIDCMILGLVDENGYDESSIVNIADTNFFKGSLSFSCKGVKKKIEYIMKNVSNLINGYGTNDIFFVFSYKVRVSEMTIKADGAFWTDDQNTYAYLSNTLYQCPTVKAESIELFSFPNDNDCLYSIITTIYCYGTPIEYIRKPPEKINDTKFKPVDSKYPLKDLRFVVTGDLVHFPEYTEYPTREKLKSFIKSRGGNLTGSISGKTNYLICNNVNSGTTKVMDAKKRGIPIISEEDFLKMAGGL